MPIDYSKFDCIDTDSDDDSAGNKRRAAPRAKAKAAGAAENAKISMAKPEAAAGSSWNHKSWHFEEMKADDWAKGRLTELFREFKDRGIDVTHEGADLRLDLTWREARAVTGSAWWTPLLPECDPWSPGGGPPEGFEQGAGGAEGTGGGAGAQAEAGAGAEAPAGQVVEALAGGTRPRPLA